MPPRPGAPWRDLFVDTGSGPSKLYVNRDASPQQQRIGGIARALRATLSPAYLALNSGLGIAVRHHDQRELVGFITFSAVDVVAIRAPSRDADPKIQFDPQFVEAHRIEWESMVARAMATMASRSRKTDTTGWLG